MNLSLLHDAFRAWVQELAREGMTVRFAHGFESSESDVVVSAVLMRAAADPQRRAHHRSSSRPLARLRYAMCVSGGNEDGQLERALIGLLAQAQRTPGVAVVDQPLTPSWWLAHGVTPRPAFVLEAAVAEAVDLPEPVLVHEHSVEMTGLEVVRGKVLAADETPVAGAEVQLLSTGQLLHCDAGGAFRFHLHAPRKEGNRGWVRVQARGVSQNFRIPRVNMEKRPWLIRLEQPGKR